MRTKIKNEATSAQFIGFLPPHGQLLAAQQEVLVDGDLRTILAGGENRFSRMTELTSMQKMMDGLELGYETIPDSQSSSSSSSSTP